LDGAHMVNDGISLYSPRDKGAAVGPSARNNTREEYQAFCCRIIWAQMEGERGGMEECR